MSIFAALKTAAMSAAQSSTQVATELLTDDGWKWRRLTLFSALGFLAGSIAFIEVRGTDTALYQQAIIAEIGSGTALVTAYVFGAIWDDKNKRMHAFGRPDVAPPASVADAPPAPAAQS